MNPKKNLGVFYFVFGGFKIITYLCYIMTRKSKHGMTSEQASERNLAGKKRENQRAQQLNGSRVVKGRKKPDIERKDGKTESVKGGKKTQWALYCLSTIQSSVFSETQKNVILKYMNFLPDDINFFEGNRHLFKNNPYVKDLFQEFETQPMNLVRYFCGYGQVDFFTLIDNRDGQTYCVNSDTFFDKLEKSIKRVYTTKGGKLVIAGGEKNTILFELELRKGSNHKRILFHSLLSRIIDVVK